MYSVTKPQQTNKEFEKRFLIIWINFESKNIKIIVTYNIIRYLKFNCNQQQQETQKYVNIQRRKSPYQRNIK